MQHFQIKRWDIGAVIYEGEAETLRDLVNTAVKDKKDLYRARLDGANLVGARLDGASFVGARLDGARFDRASLDGARFDGANLDGASFVGARLDGARFDRASLDRASLDRASLVGASLDGARLVGASLDGARLRKGEILNLRVFSGLYKYTIYAYILKDGATPCVKMGCLDFTLSEWEEKGGILKSNTSEFPDDGSAESMRRARAFNYAVAEALAMKAEIEARKWKSTAPNAESWLHMLGRPATSNRARHYTARATSAKTILCAMAVRAILKKIPSGF